MASDFKVFAEEMRQKYYGRERRDHLGPIADAEPCFSNEPEIGSKPKPCPSGIGLVRKAAGLALVVISPTVQEHISQERLRRCEQCDYVKVVGGKHYCGCCGCPMWQIGNVGSALEYKTTKAAWECPLNPPVYGKWTPDSDGLTVN